MGRTSQEEGAAGREVQPVERASQAKGRGAEQAFMAGGLGALFLPGPMHN